MKVSILIRTYEKDLKWLVYCLRSIQKYAHGFHEVVVLVPEGTTLKLTAEKVVFVPDKQPGYLAQQSDKMHADLYTTGDYVLHLDADTIFNQPVTPETFFVNGKPIWFITPIEKASPDAVAAWVPVMTRFYGVTPRYEFMRRMGQVIPRWAYGCFRDFAYRWHGKSLEAYVMDQPGHQFSEFNCCGHWLHGNFPDAFHFHNTETDGVPPSVVSQFWSWSGLTNEERATLEEAVA